MKILAVVQGFQQGWGGAPESIRLMARRLAPLGFSFDVFDLGRFHRSVERLDLLPMGDAPAETMPAGAIADYRAILVAGPWQNPARIAPVLKARRPGQPLYYLPRGGLTRADFARPRDLKKLPYLYLLERRLIDRCDGIIFSSEHERRDTLAGARRRVPEFVIPDLFDPGAIVSAAPSAEPRAPGKFTLSMLAEVSPLKGLLPLVQGFARWSASHDMFERARLVSGGRVRRGSEGYFRKVEAVRDRYAGAADIRFLGSVPHGQRAEFYRETDLKAIPSRGESFGLTLLEALSAGCAVLVSSRVGAVEYLPPHDRLFVLDDASAGGISAALENLFPEVEKATEADRMRTREYAAAAIDALNKRACAAWSDLLGSPA